MLSVPHPRAAGLLRARVEREERRLLDWARASAQGRRGRLSAIVRKVMVAVSVAAGLAGTHGEFAGEVGGLGLATADGPVRGVVGVAGVASLGGAVKGLGFAAGLVGAPGGFGFAAAGSARLLLLLVVVVAEAAAHHVHAGEVGAHFLGWVDVAAGASVFVGFGDLDVVSTRMEDWKKWEGMLTGLGVATRLTLRLSGEMGLLGASVLGASVQLFLFHLVLDSVERPPQAGLVNPRREIGVHGGLSLGWLCWLLGML